MEQEERRYADALKQQGIENELKLGNLEISRAKLAHDMDYAKQMLDLRAKELIQNGIKADRVWEQALAELGLKREQLKLSREELAARKDGSYYSKSGSTGKAPTYLDVNGTTMRYNEDALTDAASMQAANILGLGDDANSPTQARMMVGAALNNKDPKMSDEDKKKIADVTEYLIGVGAIADENKGKGEKKLGLNKKTISWDEQ
jgi:GDP-D-mannose dehydratase